MMPTTERRHHGTYSVLGEPLLVGEDVVQVTAVHAPGDRTRQTLKEH